MITDTQFLEQDAEIFDLFRSYPEDNVRVRISETDDPVIEVTADENHKRRVDRIVEKARFEAVMKDSVSFLFKTLGVGAGELTSALLNTAGGSSSGDLPSGDQD